MRHGDEKQNVTVEYLKRKNIMPSKQNELKVFISSRQSKCDDCKEELGSGAWIVLAGDKGALCLACADIDHLVFLPSGDAALTRRSKAHSTLSAVVLKWSKTRKRYERQGLLVEEDALKQAEVECLADEDARSKRRKSQLFENLDSQELFNTFKPVSGKSSKIKEIDNAIIIEVATCIIIRITCALQPGIYKYR